MDALRSSENFSRKKTFVSRKCFNAALILSLNYYDQVHAVSV